MSHKKTNYVDSDFFFNHPGEFPDGEPVDVMGAFVPQNKSLSNLKKAEKATQVRFGLEAGGESE